jgi:hypothetical protein
MHPDEKNKRAEAGEDLGTMVFTEEEVNDEEIPDESTDPPEELLSPVMERGISMGDGSGGGNRGGSRAQFTAPRDFAGERHNREIHRRTRGKDIDPEDGGPDEMTSPAASSINHVMASGQNYQPEPDGDDPDDPRASDGGATTTMISTMDHAASPAPTEGGPDGGSVIPDPRF